MVEFMFDDLDPHPDSCRHASVAQCGTGFFAIGIFPASRRRQLPSAFHAAR
jgi:hypothetical protein